MLAYDKPSDVYAKARYDVLNTLMLAREKTRDAASFRIIGGNGLEKIHMLIMHDAISELINTLAAETMDADGKHF